MFTTTMRVGSVATAAAILLLTATSIPSTAEAFTRPTSTFVTIRPATTNNINTPSAIEIEPSIISSSKSTTTCLSAIRRGGGRRQARVIEVLPPMNEEITHNEVRVNLQNTDGKDESLGIMSKSDALSRAKTLGVDLIMINANQDPPVCKIADYSKYRYAQEKKRKEKAKNSKATEIKEVKMSYKIGVADYNVRLKAATKFIKQGNRVKATVQFRGREVQHDNLGIDLLNKLKDDMEDIANMEGKPRREGRNLGAILTPTPMVVKAINDAKRQKEREKKKSKEESLARKEAADAAKKKASSLNDSNKNGDVDNRDVATKIGDVLDGIIDDDDDDIDDEDFDDASLDELLGSSKVSDDLFS